MTFNVQLVELTGAGEGREVTAAGAGLRDAEAAELAPTPPGTGEPVAEDLAELDAAGEELDAGAEDGIIVVAAAADADDNTGVAAAEAGVSDAEDGANVVVEVGTPLLSTSTDT
jgi:hypothetical protein